MKQLTIAEMEQIITMADLVPNIRYYAELFRLRELIDVAKAAESLLAEDLGNNFIEFKNRLATGAFDLKEALAKLKGKTL